MPNNFFEMPSDIQRELLIDADAALNIKPAILEKDIWLCWALNELFALPINMTFKGGTSLSKVYGLIKRFSEDIDVTIDYRVFSNGVDLSQPLSKTALKNLSERLKKELKQCVEEIILPHMKNSLERHFSEKTFKITLSENGEQLRIYYPSLFEQSEYYLQDNLLIEFGGCNSTEPSDSYTVSTFLSQLNANIDLPIAQVNVLSPIRTFWEKATLIHVECNRGRLLDNPERLSRHWYDLAMLIQSAVGKEALKSGKIFRDVLQHKTAFFNASYARYEDCLNGCFKLIPTEDELKKLRTDFLKMHDVGMFPEKTLEFDEMMSILSGLELQINNSGRSAS